MLLPKKKLHGRVFYWLRGLAGPYSRVMSSDHADRGLCATYLAAMEVLAKPWTGMLMVVLEDGPLRFSEIADRVPDIADRMLAARLKELETRRLVAREVHPGPPVRVTYGLTEVGRGYKEVSAAIGRWGALILREKAKDAAPKRTRRAG
jgi:DNA-binding HxlR family transcriptional regulator